MLRKLSQFGSKKRKDGPPGAAGAEGAAGAPPPSLGAVAEAMEELGNFKAKYLGSVTVEQARGEDVVRMAIEKVANKQSQISVSVVVTQQGIRVVDKDTGDTLQVCAWGLFEMF